MTIDTCPKDEYLEMQDEIYNLAKALLNEEELNSAEQISLDLVSSKKKKERARVRLRNFVGFKPKRPIFYVNADLRFLPRHTRNPIRDLGDYIDHLMKYWSAENNGEIFLKKSLGENLLMMKGKMPEDLRLKLILYNNLCYVPAKHDFNVKKRRHRFTSKEAVYISYITIALARLIIPNSEKARKYSNDEVEDDWASMQYAKENKDTFIE